MDRRGRVEKRVEAAPNPPPRAVAQRHAQRRETEQAESHRRAIRDQFLIETFQDKAPVRAAYDAKLSSLDTSIALAASAVEKLTAQSAAASVRGGATAEQLRQEINSIDQQLVQQRGCIEERRRERREIDDAARADIARFEPM